MSMSEFHAHLAEDALEEYAFNRLPEAELEAFEEHLLLCEPCQQRLQEVDEYIGAMKVGIAAHKAQPSSAFSIPAFRAAPIPALRAAAPMIWTTACALLLLLTAPALMRMLGRLPAQAAPVELAAFRGTESMAQGPADRPLDLSIDAADLPVFAAYRITVVTSSGRSRWSGIAAAQSGRLLAHIPEHLPPGVYWVRLSAEPGELLREFGLRVQ